MRGLPRPSAALKVRCLEARRANIRDRLKAAGLDGLIAYGTGRHSFLASNPAWYVTGFRQIGPHMAVILPVDAEPAALITPVYDLARAGERIDLADVQAVEPLSFLPALGALIDRLGLRKARLAVAGGNQPRIISDAWPSLLGCPPAPGDQLISDLARIRDEHSLACVGKAVSIAEDGHQFILETLRPGLPEYQLAAEAEAYMRGLGAEDNFQLLSGAQHNRAAHRPSARIFAEGDILLSEITPAVDGEYVQICRTTVLGTATAEQRDAFALLDGALCVAMAAATPGTSTLAVVDAMDAPIIAAGFGAYTKPPYIRTRGHSMALGSMDPEIARDSGHVLQKGMVFVLHPNQYFPHTGYMMCGEPVIIGDDGASCLTSRMGRLDVVAA